VSGEPTVVVYGGSFNPPHVAHVLAVAYVLSTLELHRVLVVPVYDHVFDKDLAPFEQRISLCQAAFGWLPQVLVSDVEAHLPAPSYTLQTLEALAREHPDWKLRLLIGSDVLHEKHKWQRFDRIEAIAPPVVIGRQGHPHPDAPFCPLPEISSTHVRSLLRSPSSPARDAELERLVPSRVLGIIEERGLYR